MDLPPRRRTAAVAAVGAALLSAMTVAACSSGGSSGGLSGDSSGSSATVTPAPTVTSASPSSSGGTTTVVFDRTAQQELLAVGCYHGAIDGVVGPETDAAILAFQQAEGLNPDGEFGLVTQAALAEAARNGKQVCQSTATATPSPSSTGSGQPPCTASAMSAALGGARVLSYVCAQAGAERWAAGQQKDGPAVMNFFLQAQGSAWKPLPIDEICGEASAGLPPVILKYCGPT